MAAFYKLFHKYRTSYSEEFRTLEVEQLNEKYVSITDICIQHQWCVSRHPNHCELRKQIYECCKLGELTNFFLVHNLFTELQMQN